MWHLLVLFHPQIIAPSAQRITRGELASLTVSGSRNRAWNASLQSSRVRGGFARGHSACFSCVSRGASSHFRLKYERRWGSPACCSFRAEGRAAGGSWSAISCHLQRTAWPAAGADRGLVLPPRAGACLRNADPRPAAPCVHARRASGLTGDFSSHTCSAPLQREVQVSSRRPAKDTGFSVSFDSPLPGPATTSALLSSPIMLYLLAEETGYSQASYYTTLGLFLMSFPGLYSLIMRAPKAKVRSPQAGHVGTLRAAVCRFPVGVARPRRTHDVAS